MSKSYMDQILAWANTVCPWLNYISLVRAVISDDSVFSKKCLTLESQTLYTKILMNMAFSTTAWNLWTR
jgi:hypothetical protein